MTIGPIITEETDLVHALIVDIELTEVTARIVVDVAFVQIAGSGPTVDSHLITDLDQIAGLGLIRAIDVTSATIAATHLIVVISALALISAHQDIVVIAGPLQLTVFTNQAMVPIVLTKRIQCVAG